MSYMLQPQIILLREGTDTSQGKGQLVSNINACQAVAEVIKSTLGPRGMDKLVYDGKKMTISNDGATILKLLEIEHPAARTLVDISMSQDAEVGDGTTSVVLLTAEILKNVKSYVEENLHPQIIIRALRRACGLSLNHLKSLSVSFEGSDARTMLEKCAGTALNSKLIASNKELFAPMVVDAISALDPNLLDLNMIGIKKVQGGSVTDSFLVQGVAYKKTFSYAGYEQQPKSFSNPKVLLLNVELELKSEKENAEIRLTDPDDYQSIVDAEWQIIYEKLEACVASGAQIILSKLPIGDLATQYFADRDLSCHGRVASDDMERVSKATGAVMQTSVFGITENVLGNCEKYEEVQIGNERFELFTGCPSARTATIILRGGADQFLEESDRSIHDALMIVKRAVDNKEVVAGGGATEMELNKLLKIDALGVMGKEQPVIEAFAKALEVIPHQLAVNAGFDSTDLLNKLRQRHAKDKSGKWFGINVSEEGIFDTFEESIWEPTINKRNSIEAATEAACLILSIDETIRNPKSEKPGAPDSSGMGLAPVSAGMGGRGMAGMLGGGDGEEAEGCPEGLKHSVGEAELSMLWLGQHKGGSERTARRVMSWLLPPRIAGRKPLKIEFGDTQ
eukprot:CAMPEP_0117763492 /NCGR_PEP_ID=MMETSP0947-20121206/18690_1 /TAXON_ID=44440 /ORGANISM="Chattonella subsalsa, Strain CCMP2191" /LENGTH=622 /DNA_ID=CAMNT_0005585249 /DNA_START=33 /DNA_END=1902 /DNA_ORIENTATION=+